MASTTETGNAKNVANFEDLISFCTGYGTSYNPSKASIKLASLTTKQTEAVTALASVNTKLSAWTNAVNDREIAFNPLSKLVTRIVNAVAASDVSKQVLDDVKTIARKLQGRRASPKKDPTPDDPTTPENESTKSISASQMSFDSRIESMDKLIQLLSAQPNYTPNETDLNVAGLTTLFTEMKNVNTAVVNTYTTISNTRIDRNKILYYETTGLVKVANDVKAYIKSVFGATSPQYKQVSKLKFVKIGKN
jgi:hypothetical protein